MGTKFLVCPTLMGNPLLKLKWVNLRGLKGRDLQYGDASQSVLDELFSTSHALLQEEHKFC